MIDRREFVQSMIALGAATSLRPAEAWFEAPNQELKALADFYGSAVGKSAMKKFGTYMADVMPDIQAEMIKAQAKANREEKAPQKAEKE